MDNSIGLETNGEIRKETKGNILFIYNDYDLSRMMGEYFSKFGYNSFFGNNYEEVREVLVANNLRAIITNRDIFCRKGEHFINVDEVRIPIFFMTKQRDGFYCGCGKCYHDKVIQFKEDKIFDLICLLETK